MHKNNLCIRSNIVEEKIILHICFEIRMYLRTAHKKMAAKKKAVKKVAKKKVAKKAAKKKTAKRI